jgi:hypothetical protein
MSMNRRRKTAWFVVSLIVFIGLFYPAMMYLDLAGMGGYDGFASSQMMLDHGTWRADADRPTAVYLIFAAIYVTWLLSLVSLVLEAFLLGLAAILKRRARK